MSELKRILRGGAVSQSAQDDEKSLHIDAPSTVSNLHLTDWRYVIDANEQFIKERDACGTYRVIATINPFCTNVLFNACTEIVKDEGSENVSVVTETDRANLYNSGGMVYGKVSSVSQYDMVRNTEYSKDDVGYVYHPGSDIFNNHILRNKTYRIVNRPSSSAQGGGGAMFNTIDDLMRDSRGKKVLKCCRLDVGDTEMKEKHLYDYDNILEFWNSDAVNDNLKEDNGWFGFYNTSVIPSKNETGEDMDISRALNNYGNCEFVDMYPDRTLFSLVPKYNRFRNRLERNWDFLITYPFDKTVTYDVEAPGGGTDTEEFKVISDGGCNGIAVMDAQYVILPNGVNALLLRSAVRHNLKVGDKFTLFFDNSDGNSSWTEIPHTCIVNGLGDLDNNYQEYYFYTTDSTVLEYIFAPESETATKWDYIKSYFYKGLDLSTVPSLDSGKTYYPGNLVKYNGAIYICDIESVGFDSDKFRVFDPTELPYYFEGLTDIPSPSTTYINVEDSGSHRTAIYELYNHDMNLPYHTSAYDANRFIRNIVNNAFRDEENVTEGHSPETITDSLYRDYIQFRFAKTNGLYKSEYYVRKFRKLPNIKYGTDGENPLVDSDFDNEYYKLGFATTIYGDDIAQEVVIDDVRVEGLSDNLGRPLGDIYFSIFKTNRGYKEWYYGEGDGKGDENVEFSHCFGPVTSGFDIFGLPTDSSSIKTKRKLLNDVHMICNSDVPTIRSLGGIGNITSDDDWFYGDIAEFCPWECAETPLCDVCFRFNTVQREFEDMSAAAPYVFSFDEIVSDDYDYGGFKTAKYTIDGGIEKKEGYYYSPHKLIRLKGFGNVNQASHRALIVSNAVPVQMDGVFIKVTSVINHGMTGGERVRLRSVSDQSHEWWLNVVSVVNKQTFVMEKIPHGSDDYIDWIAICNGLNSKEYVLEVENTSIPWYAYRIGPNTYLWRYQTNKWDADNVAEGLKEYPFANGCLYVDSVFSLYLRRQDPYGKNSLASTKPLTAVSDDDTREATCLRDLVGVVPQLPTAYYKDDSLSIC